MTGDTHKNHVGIGITRRSYNIFRKKARKEGISMRQLLDNLAKTLKEVSA